MSLRSSGNNDGKDNRLATFPFHRFVVIASALWATAHGRPREVEWPGSQPALSRGTAVNGSPSLRAEWRPDPGFATVTALRDAKFAREGPRAPTHSLSGPCLCRATVGQAVLPVPGREVHAHRLSTLSSASRTDAVSHIWWPRASGRAPCLRIEWGDRVPYRPRPVNGQTTHFPRWTAPMADLLGSSQATLVGATAGQAVLSWIRPAPRLSHRPAQYPGFGGSSRARGPSAFVRR